jgi:ABC-type microcin C transport system permease subunit YejB
MARYAAGFISRNLRYMVVLPIPSNRAARRGLRFDLRYAARIIVRSISAIVGKWSAATASFGPGFGVA